MQVMLQERPLLHARRWYVQNVGIDAMNTDSQAGVISSEKQSNFAPGISETTSHSNELQKREVSKLPGSGVSASSPDVQKGPAR